MKVLVTGATGAIGKEIVHLLASKGHDILLGCRSQKKGEILAKEIEVIYGRRPQIIIIDLSDASSVSKASNHLSGECLDALINNAGVMNGKYILDGDGHEDTINVNYHNTRLLTQLLIDRITDGGVIVFTTSATRRWYPFQRIMEDIPESKFGRLKTYALSKKLITRYAATMAADKEIKKRGIRINCADPGVVDTPMLSMGKWFDRLTDIFFRPFCLKPSTAAKTSVRALESPESGYIFKSPKGKSLNKKKLDL